MELLRGVGHDGSRGVIHFYPIEVEKKLAEIEAKAAEKTGVPVEETRTIFGVQRANGKYQFIVLE